MKSSLGVTGRKQRTNQTKHTQTQPNKTEQHLLAPPGFAELHRYLAFDAGIEELSSAHWKMRIVLIPRLDFTQLKMSP